MEPLNVQYRVAFDRADLTEREVQIVNLVAEMGILQLTGLMALAGIASNAPELTPEQVERVTKQVASVIERCLPGTNARVVLRAAPPPA